MLYDVSIAYDETRTWSDVIEADDVEDAEYKARKAFNEDTEGLPIHNVDVEFIQEVKKR